MNTLTWDQFETVDIRVGTIITAVPFEKAKKPAYILTIDFGPLGVKTSSAQITERHSCEELIGTQVCAVVNFPPKQIANVMSKCLVLAAVGDTKGTTLLSLRHPVANGLRVS